MGKLILLKNSKRIPKKTYIYYSLNGATNASEVINSIYLELFTSGKYNDVFNQGREITSAVINFLKEKTEKVKLVMDISSSVMDYCLNFAVKKELNEKSNNIVVILDDLERISELLDITDLLGTIHTKLTLNGVKVIYIAAENEIKDSDKEKFNREKEKYIQRILNFSTDKNEVLTSFLDDYEINSPNYMEIMCKVLDEQQINLRTVKFCLECFNDIRLFYNSLPADEYNSPDSLFFTICQIGKFYRNGHTDKELLKEELESYYIKNYLNNTSEKQKTDYEIFAQQFGSNLVKESFIFDLIFDGILSEEELKFYLRKPNFNQDSLFALSGVLDMETSELKEILNQVIQNLKSEKYSIKEYYLLKVNFLPYVVKVDVDTKESVLNLISKSIFAEHNKKELEQMFDHWLKDTFSRIKNPENDFEQQLLEHFNNYCEKIDSAKAEDFYKCLINCDRRIYEYKFEYTIITSLVKRGYIKRILSMPNKSVRYFSYFINSAICRLKNAYDFYTTELPALEQIKAQCDEIQKQIDKADVLY